MSGVKGKSGRKPKSQSREDAMRSFTLKLPKAINVIAATMEGKNRDKMKYEAACRVEDRVMGKAPMSIDARIKALRVYSPDELQLMSQPLLDEAKLLNAWAESEPDTENSASKDSFNKGEDNV